MKIPSGVLLAGAANCAISFNIVNISLSLHVLRNLHSEVNNEVSICASALLIGMIIGQLLFGGLGDCIGRERSLMYALLVCAVGAIGSAVGVSSTSIAGVDVFSQLAVWRFLLGIGGGGVYPLMAVIAKESVAKEKCHLNAPKAMAITFSMQGFGYIVSPLSMLLLLLFPFSHDESGNPTDMLWRVHLGIGALPLVVVLSFVFKRLRKLDVECTPSIELTETGEEGAALPLNGSPRANRRARLLDHLLDRKVAWLLAGTALPWLLFDIMFYGNTLFVPRVLEAIIGNLKSEDFIQTECIDDLVIKLISLPGYIIAVFVIEKTGPKKLQMIGFFVMALAYGAIGILFDQLPEYPHLALMLYSVTFLFSNLGPNSTTFVMPSMLFDEEVRSSMSGVSGASGKVGAIIGTLVFDPLSKEAGVGTVLMICGCVSILSLLITVIFVPETTGTENSIEPGESAGLCKSFARSLSNLKRFLSKWLRCTGSESSYRRIECDSDSTFNCGFRCDLFGRWFGTNMVPFDLRRAHKDGNIFSTRSLTSSHSSSETYSTQSEC